MEHSISVKELMAVLALLPPDDILFPNRVANLSIERDGKLVGFIDLLAGIPHEDRLQIFDDEEGSSAGRVYNKGGA